MRKSVLSFLVLLMFFSSVLPVYSTVETPEKPSISYDVSCPPDYVGQSKCFYIERKDKTIISDAIPQQSNKPIGTTSGGKVLYKHPYTWALGTAMGFLTSQSDTMQSAVDGFWNDVNKVDLAVGSMANSLTDSMKEELQNSYDLAQKSGNGLVYLGSDLWDLLMGNGFQTLADINDDFATNYDDSFKIPSGFSGVGGPYASASVSHFMIQESDRLSNYKPVRIEKNNSTSVRVHGVAYEIDESIYVSTSMNIYIVDLKFGSYGFGSNTYKTLQDAVASVSLGNHDYPFAEIKEGYSKPSGTSSGTNGGGSYVTMPIYTNHSYPKVVEVDNKKYYEVDNPSNPGIPNLLPLGDTTSKPLSGGVVVEGDTGKLIDNQGTPTGTPLTEPIEQANPQKTPVGGGVGGGTGGIGGGVDGETGGTSTKNPEEEANRFSALFTNKFPFSLPWDIYNMIAAVTVEAERPELIFDKELNLSLRDNEKVKIYFEHDFEWMDSWIGFFRAFILIGFSIFLILGTRRLLGGAQ